MASFVEFMLIALSIAAFAAGTAFAQDGTVTIRLRDDFELSWLVSADGKEVHFEAVAMTTGYIGVGFSPNGAMIGADIVIGGVRSGTPYLHDMHGDAANGPPILDDVNDYTLIAASENGTHTRISFSRLLHTCDDQDMPLTEDSVRVIWSLGGNDDLNYHGSTNRGTRSAYILDPEVPVPDLSHLAYFDLVSNFTMPSRKTTYWCTIHRLPDLQGEHQMIAYDVLLPTEASRKHAHHMNVLKCLHGFNPDKQYGPWVGHRGVNCNTNTDDDGATFPGETCLFLEYGWALGGEIAVNPDDVGFPFVSGQYLKLEVHLDNPDLEEGVEVSTGFRIYYTDKPKPVTGSLLMVAAPVDFHQMIPPNSTEFVTTAHCMPTCTDIVGWPKEGVTAYNAFLHAHTSARKMRIRHFRGSQELPWLINDENYDFNYQTNRRFPQTVQILPGDQITAECTYDTHWKNGLSVIGGQSTDDEMCMVFIAYYPAISNFIGCQDAMTAKNILNTLGIEQVKSSGKDPEVIRPPAMAGKKISKIVEEFNWTRAARDEYQWRARYGTHVAVCLPRINVHTASYPHVPDYEPEQVCVDKKQNNNGASRPEIVTAINSLVLAFASTIFAVFMIVI